MPTHTVTRTILSLVGLITLSLNCTVQPRGGGNQGRLPEDEVPDVIDQGGFFSSTEAWSIASEQFIGAGFGTRYEFLALYETGTDAVCLGLDPSGTVKFDGEQLQFLAEYNGVDNSEFCELAATGDGASCAPTPTDAAFGFCQISNATGGTIVDGSLTELDRYGVTRFGPCGDQLTPISLANDWVLFNVHPFAVFLINDPADVGSVIVVSGEREGVSGVAIATSTDAAQNAACQDDDPEGTVSFDLAALEVNLQTAAGCSIQFTGDLIYCAELDPSSFGGTGPSSLIMRIEGAGQFTTPDGAGVIDVMYLGYGGNTQIPVRQ